MVEDDDEGADLLRRAESLLDDAAHGPALDQATLQLVRELSLHQIELELQREELARSRDEVAKSLARYVDLYDFAPAGYLTVSQNGSVLTSNLAAARLIGLERSRLSGCVIHDFVADHDRERFDEYWRLATEELDEHSDEFDLVEASGEFTTVALHTRRPVDQGVWRVALLDVTELHEARRAAADRMELARSDGTARHLHDSIRQRLFGVTALIDGLRREKETPAIVNRGLERAQKEMTDIITEIREIIFRETGSPDRPSGDDPPAEDPTPQSE
jgi:PAS domain S-box-containing protein